ncbi:hypothetical protein V8F06_002854 [Rhypophila decipiens]
MIAYLAVVGFGSCHFSLLLSNAITTNRADITMTDQHRHACVGGIQLYSFAVTYRCHVCSEPVAKDNSEQHATNGLAQIS